MNDVRPSSSDTPVRGLTQSRADVPEAGNTGADIHIRRIRPADAAGLEAFYAALSEDSRRTRFFGLVPGIGRAQSNYFCMPDHAHREGFVATRDDRVIGHVCVEPDGSACVEMAIAVAEDVRGQGLGRRLVEVAVAWARGMGYSTVRATMLTGNPAIQRLLFGLGLPVTATARGAGTIDIRIDLGHVPAAAA